MKPYTDADKAKWRTGLYAANPQQMQALMYELDRMTAAIVQGDIRLDELSVPIEEVFEILPETVLGRAVSWMKSKLGVGPTTHEWFKSTDGRRPVPIRIKVVIK